MVPLRFCLYAALAIVAIGRVDAVEEVIMTAPARLEVGHRIGAQNNNCRLVLHNDGNLVVKRRIPGLDDSKDEWRVAWDTGAEDHTGEYYAELQDNGALHVFEKMENDALRFFYRTAIETRSGTHELVMDSACRLKIKTDGEETWANIKIPPFKTGQILQKGEMFRMTINVGAFCSIQYPFQLHYILKLQHDCNLVQFVDGTDSADQGSVVWSSGTPMPDAYDCYMYLDKGQVALYEGHFEVGQGLGADRPYMYWSTPASWMDTSFYSDEVQENYEILLELDGSMFHWRSYNPDDVWPA